MLECPICKKKNHCTADEQCWCMSAVISEQALSQLPDEAKACICQACAQKYSDLLKTV
ncbi:MAG: cysteine-rich CWC family protein [Solibacillus sp.]